MNWAGTILSMLAIIVVVVVLGVLFYRRQERKFLETHRRKPVTPMRKPPRRVGVRRAR